MARRLLIIALLLVSLGYACYTYWPVLFPTPKAVPAVSSAPAPGAPAGQAASMEANQLAQQELEMFLPTIEAKMADPFAIRTTVLAKAEAPPPSEENTRPGEKRAAPPEPKLEGIWYENDLKVAFISGQTASVGNQVMGWTVTSISKERVVLQKGSATKTLKLEVR
ncbi:MAG: hypothetical protein PHH14_00240 [Candidatus Margulisbacteria bacterium]|nr:hypothetical protein [Candidatus Margulisiibacteriota bacterium]